MTTAKSYALIGIGNPLRADDGIAHWVCAQFEKLQLPNIQIFTYHQLHTEVIERWLGFDEIIIIDAEANTNAVTLESISNNAITKSPSSHHTEPEVLKGLIQELYKKEIAISVCKIGANNFTLGESISNQTLNNGAAAVAIIKQKISSQV